MRVALRVGAGLISLLLAGGTAGCRASASSRTEVSAEILEDLATLATGTIPTRKELQAAQEGISSGKMTLEGYVKSLVNSHRLSHEVAPDILLGIYGQPWANVFAMPAVLKAAAPDAKGRVVHYLSKPCSADVAEKVRPWWAMNTELSVCPDSHQPTHLRDPGSALYCDAFTARSVDPVLDMSVSSASGYCGCGLNLIYCVPGEEQSFQTLLGYRREAFNTIGRIVETDRPIADVFTVNETFRERNVEMDYLRARILSGELKQLPSLEDWPKEGKWAARHDSMPQQHAGVLTNPLVLRKADTPRARLRDFAELLWCISPASSGIETEQILNLGAVNLRDGDGWQKLARMPVCTNCHARLDYGVQFFPGFPSSFRSNAIIATEYKAGTGPMYMHDDKDKRGDGPLTPGSWAHLAVAQPEFADCMIQRVSNHVLGRRSSAEDEAVLKSAMKARPTFRNLMQVALLQYAKHRLSAQTVPDFEPKDPDPATLQVQPPDAPVTLSAEQQTFIEENCVSCHNSGDALNLQLAQLPRLTAERAMYQVAFGLMPKEDPIPAVERRHFVKGFAAKMQQRDPDEWRRTFDYFASGLRPLPAHAGRNALEQLYQNINKAMPADAEWPGQENGLLDSQFVTILGHRALEVCEQAGQNSSALEQCLARELRVEGVAK